MPGDRGMTENFYYGIKRIASRLGISESLARKLCKDGVILAQKTQKIGPKQVWWSSESNIIKTIQERFPEML